MACIKDFNDTLFELTDEMMVIINPSPVMTTAYGVFKSMYASNPDNDVAVNAFWEVAKDNAEMIQKKDVQAMADVLRGVIPMPGMIDEVWEALSDENRGVVGDYVSVLYEQAAEIQRSKPPASAKEGDDDGHAKEESEMTMYSMYNTIWNDFLLLLESCARDDDACAMIRESREKLEHVLKTKGASTSMPFSVMLPCLEMVLPENAIENEADVLALCLPPIDPLGRLVADCATMGEGLFPFNRKLPFSNLLGIATTKSVAEDTRQKLAMYWHYIKLFSICVKECPPEVVGMMNQMIAFFNQSQASVPNFFFRDDPTLLTK